MNFKQAHSSNFSVGRMCGIKYLVIHYTSNDGDTAQNNVDYYSREPNLGASAHYYVDKKEVWQSVKEGNTAWHCGTKQGYKHKYCRNSNSIGIELCSRYRGNLKEDKKSNKVDFTKYYFEDAVVINAAKLTKELMAKYNIPIENVVRHYDVTGKTCPAPMVINDDLWNKFKAMLTENNYDKGELSVTQYEELKKEISDLKERNKVLESIVGALYKTEEEIPEYYKAPIKRLIENGSLKGTGDGLNLPEIIARTLVIIDRDKRV